MDRAWSRVELQRRCQKGSLSLLRFIALQAGEHGSQRHSRSAWILAIPCIAAAGLGTWQVQRRSWKMDLIERRAAALQASLAVCGLQGGCGAAAFRAAIASRWLCCSSQGCHSVSLAVLPASRAAHMAWGQWPGMPAGGCATSCVRLPPCRSGLQPISRSVLSHATLAPPLAEPFQ